MIRHIFFLISALCAFIALVTLGMVVSILSHVWILALLVLGIILGWHARGRNSIRLTGATNHEGSLIIQGRIEDDSSRS